MHYRLRDAAHLLLAVAAPGIDTSSKYFTGVLTGSPSLRMSETEKQVTALFVIAKNLTVSGRNCAFYTCNLTVG
jgi:hypothetical protein